MYHANPERRQASPSPSTPTQSRNSGNSWAPVLTNTQSQMPTTTPTITCITIPGGPSGTKMEETLDTKSGNWTSWSCLMNYLIQMVDIKDYVDGTLPCPDPAQDPLWS